MERGRGLPVEDYERSPGSEGTLQVWNFQFTLYFFLSEHCEAFGTTDIVAAALMLFFLTIETIADNQLFSFHRQKRAPKPEKYHESVSKGFMTEGLWSVVRHPNFTSEQAIWISFYIFSIGASGKVLNYSVAGALLLILLFMGSTRLTERITRSKYPQYIQYMKEVPMVIPSFRRIFSNNRR
jgi:steroid 5-alpha reductase family enzyme